MLWFNAHSRTRNKLSPYVDGQLSPDDRTALEKHLADCEICTTDLADLRATISAIGALGDAEPPRSFALTPQMLERRAVVPPAPTPPIATGMRLAGAAVAIVLAVVLIGDMGGLGSNMDDTASDEAGSARESIGESRTMEFDAAGGGDNAPAATTRAAPTDNADLAASADKTEACVPTTNMLDATASAPAESPPQPAASPAMGLVVPGGEEACAPEAPATGAPLEGEALTDAGDGQAAQAPESGSGDDAISTLTILEIILAGSLVALLGGVAVEYAMRRRRAV